MKRLLRLTAIALCVSSVAPAYYHFVHFSSQLGQSRPIPEKFDLNVLPGKTLTYFIDDNAGVQMASGDSYDSLISQIRAAAGVWNDVDASDLRLGFGGVTSPSASQSAPSAEVLFAEVPPGLVAMGGPTVRAAANGLFVPILKSVVIIQPDLRNRPSYTEAMFSTLVHEFGHALGLQHTLTSGVMATATTRATSKARPLSADDIAAISVLYPRTGLVQTTGSIAGRVTMNDGQAVNLASVVAIAANGLAVSTLSNPDGTYRIENLPAMAYYVYVHPLPPPREGQSTPADIVYPVDQDNKPLTVGQPFETVFYAPAGGVKDLAQAGIVVAPAGVPTENINFTVHQRVGYSINSVETYAFPGNIAVKPPYLSRDIKNPFVVATGSGLIAGSSPTTGLRASVLGGVDLLIKPYPSAPTSYLELDIDQRTLLVPSDTPRHVLFSANNDIYVLPSAFFYVNGLPPQILSVTPSTDAPVRTLVLGANNVTANTKIYLDGAAATVRTFEDLGSGNQRITIVPPSAAPGHRAVITALNNDGQSSLFLQGDNPPSYTYPGDGSSAQVTPLAASPNGLPPGSEALIQIDGVNTTFVDGQVAVGFGSSDIVVRRVWVVSPTRLMVNVAVGPSAQQGTMNLTLASGLQLLTQPLAFSIQPPPARPFWLSSSVTNSVTGQTSVSPGSLVTMQLGATPGPLSTAPTVVFNQQPLSAAVNGNQVSFVIPQNAATGFASVRLESGNDHSLSIGLNIDPTPPKILSATLATAELRNPRLGDTLVVSVANLNPSKSRVGVQIGNKDGQVVQVIGDGDKETVVVQVPADAPTGEGLPLTVSADSSRSDPITITITN